MAFPFNEYDICDPILTKKKREKKRVFVLNPRPGYAIFEFFCRFDTRTRKDRREKRGERREERGERREERGRRGERRMMMMMMMMMTHPTSTSSSRRP